jgi:hypothetical protein
MMRKASAFQEEAVRMQKEEQAVVPRPLQETMEPALDLMKNPKLNAQHSFDLVAFAVPVPPVTAVPSAQSNQEHLQSHCLSFDSSSDSD